MDKKLNLNGKMSLIKKELKIKKTGTNPENKKINYFKMEDFLPQVQDLMAKYGVNEVISIESFYPEGTVEIFKNSNIEISASELKALQSQRIIARLYDTESDEVLAYEMPFIVYPTEKFKTGNKQMMDIQNYGSMMTYQKRYLYYTIFGISEEDGIDEIDTSLLSKDNFITKPVVAKAATPKPIKPKTINPKPINPKPTGGGETDLDKAIIRVQEYKELYPEDSQYFNKVLQMKNPKQITEQMVNYNKSKKINSEELTSKIKGTPIDLNEIMKEGNDE